MLNYRTYIDESGNTGENLTDPNQKFFVLAAVSVPLAAEAILEQNIQRLFHQVKEIEETEIKASRWIKAPKKNAVLKQILQDLIRKESDFSVVIVEKRYMAAALIVDKFLDGAYNDIEDYTWCNNRNEKKVAAQYFYDVMSDEDINFIAEAFTKPTLERTELALQKVINKTSHDRYLNMLHGCHVEELYEYDLKKGNSSYSGFDSSLSPNYVSFPAIGKLVLQYCQKKEYDTELIFDNCLRFNKEYRQIFDLFEHMQPNEILEMLGLSPWTNTIKNFSVADSKSTYLLQTADIVATSVLKTLDKLFNNSTFNDYNDYIIGFIKDISKSGGLWWVMSDKYVTKLYGTLV